MAEVPWLDERLARWVARFFVERMLRLTTE